MTAPDEAFVAGVIEKLTEAQRRVIIETTPDEAHSRRIGPHTTVWANLYRKGILSDIRVGGFMFYDLTPLGLAVRHQLLRMESDK